MFTTKRGKFFNAGWKEGEKIPWKSSKCRNRADFVEWLKQLEQSDRKKRPAYTLSNYIPLLKDAVRSSTLEGYIASLRTLQRVVRHKDISSVTVNDLETYKTTRLKGDRRLKLRKITPTTLNIELRGIRAPLPTRTSGESWWNLRCEDSH